VVVLTFGTWAGVFGRDPNVIGRTIALWIAAPTRSSASCVSRSRFQPRGPAVNGEPAALLRFNVFHAVRTPGIRHDVQQQRRRPIEAGVTLDAARSEIQVALKR
jgi:hypothetical protein